MEKFPLLRAAVNQKLITTLSSIKSGKVFRGVLWILGEYVEDQEGIESVMAEVRKVIGELPIGASEQRALDDVGGVEEDADKSKDGEKKEGGRGGRPKVLADGTYATETAYTSTANAKLDAVKAAAKPPLRSEFSLMFSLMLVLIRP